MDNDLEEYVEEFKEACSGISIAFVRTLSNRIRRLRETGNKLFLCGNGGSSSTAQHAVVDFLACPGGATKMIYR